jgi:hypothetical protein
MKMDEQRQQNRTQRVVKQILRCFGIGLLVIVLVFALVLQAPWKVTVPLLVTVLACVILPEKLRQWFWLCVAMFFVVLAIWVFVPDGDSSRWKPYTFDDEIAALQAESLIPDEQNAATIYNALLADYGPAAMKFSFLNRRLKTLTIQQLWLSEQHPELAKWVRQRRALIAELIEAGQMEKCRFRKNLDFVITDEVRVDRYPALRHWATLLLRSANNNVAEGRPDQAVAEYTCVLQMADHLCRQQTMLDFLVGFGIEGIGLLPLNRFVIEGHPNQGQLERICESFNSLDNNWSADFHKCLEYDKLFMKNAFCTFAYEVNPQGKIRVSRNPAAVIRPGLARRPPAQDYWEKTSAKASALLASLFFPSTPQEVTELIDDLYVKYHVMAEPGFNWREPAPEPAPRVRLNPRFMLTLFTHTTRRLYRPFRGTYFRQLTLRRGSRLLPAIREYRMEHDSWPPDLDAIESAAPPEAFIDPVTDARFAYKNHGQYFSLKGQLTDIWPK